MGGPGSTRWFGYQKKCLVEDCLVFEVSYVAAMLRGQPSRTSGVITWVDPETETVRGSCACEVETTDHERAWLCLRYHCQIAGRAPTPVEDRIALVFTDQGFGGRRLWRRCPAGCGRRVRKLYRPPHMSRFACRSCHALTYKCSQTAHRYDRGTHAQVARMMGISPKLLQAQVQAWRESRRRAR